MAYIKDEINAPISFSVDFEPTDANLKLAISRIKEKIYSRDTDQALLFIAKNNLINRALELLNLTNITLSFRQAYIILYYFALYALQIHIYNFNDFIEQMSEMNLTIDVDNDNYNHPYVEITVNLFVNYNTFPYCKRIISNFDRIVFNNINYDNIPFIKDKWGMLNCSEEDDHTPVDDFNLFKYSGTERLSENKLPLNTRIVSIINRNINNLPRTIDFNKSWQENAEIWEENYRFFTDKELVELYGTFECNIYNYNFIKRMNVEKDSETRVITGLDVIENEYLHKGRVTYVRYGECKNEKIDGLYFESDLYGTDFDIKILEPFFELKEGDKLTVQQIKEMILKLGGLMYYCKNGVRNGEYMQCLKNEYQGNNIIRCNFLNSHLHGVHINVKEDKKIVEQKYYIYGKEVTKDLWNEYLVRMGLTSRYIRNIPSNIKGLIQEYI